MTSPAPGAVRWSPAPLRERTSSAHLTCLTESAVPSTVIVQVPSSPPQRIATCTSTGQPFSSVVAWSSPRPTHDHDLRAISAPSHSRPKPFVSSSSQRSSAASSRGWRFGRAREPGSSTWVSRRAASWSSSSPTAAGPRRLCSASRCPAAPSSSCSSLCLDGRCGPYAGPGSGRRVRCRRPAALRGRPCATKLDTRSSAPWELQATLPRGTTHSHR